MRFTLFVVLLMGVLSHTHAQYYFPPKTGTWENTTPSSLGWCVSEIDSLYNYLDKADTKAFIVLKDGKIVIEKYFDNFVQDSLWYWASAGKTLTAMAVGIAAREGYLKLSDTSSKYLGAGWSSLTPEQEAKITVWNHLTMTTGLDDGLSDADCTDKGCLVYKANPGTRWAYHNAPYTLLDKVIEGATGQNLNTFIAARIKTPTGMDGAYIKLGYNNVYFSTARSMARYGLLLLNKGKWNSSDVLGDTSYFKAMTSSSQTLNYAYGYLTWLNGKQSFMVPGLQIVFPGTLMADAPADMFSALGKNSQYINVVPSKGLVLVRMGNDPPQGGGLVPTTFDNNIWKYMNRIMCTNSVPEYASVAAVSLKPNPASERAEITGLNAAADRIRVFTASGQLIAEQWHTSSVDLKNIHPGIYILDIESSQKSYRLKLIKE